MRSGATAKPDAFWRQQAELIDWSRDRLAGYKRPRSCSFVAADELPRNATGKVLYRVLKAQLAPQAGAGTPA